MYSASVDRVTSPEFVGDSADTDTVRTQRRKPKYVLLLAQYLRGSPEAGEGF